MDGVQCDVWQLVEMAGKKKNTYTMWVNSKTQEPVRYEMMGYDTLFGSHYDKYYVDYKNYQTQNISESMFSPPESKEENLFCKPVTFPNLEELIPVELSAQLF